MIRTSEFEMAIDLIKSGLDFVLDAQELGYSTVKDITRTAVDNNYALYELGAYKIVLEHNPIVLEPTHEVKWDGMKVKVVYKIDTVDEAVWNYDVGRNCKEIEYHEPQCEGDAHYCDVTFNDGSINRIFRPDCIEKIKVPTTEWNDADHE